MHTDPYIHRHTQTYIDLTYYCVPDFALNEYLVYSMVKLKGRKHKAVSKGTWFNEEFILLVIKETFNTTFNFH